MDNKKLASITGSKQIIEETKLTGEEQELTGPKKIADRESDYHKGRHRRQLSQEREDAFAKPNDTKKRSFRDIMEDQRIENEKADLKRQI